MTLELEFTKGEAKRNITFKSVNIGDDGTESINDVSTAEVEFVVKKNQDDSENKIRKVTADFDRTDGSNGNLKLNLSSIDLNLEPGCYVGQLKISFSSDNVDKSELIEITINPSIL